MTQHHDQIRLGRFQLLTHTLEQLHHSRRFALLLGDARKERRVRYSIPVTNLAIHPPRSSPLSRHRSGVVAVLLPKRPELN
jgi:hypothetical protein